MKGDSYLHRENYPNHETDFELSQLFLPRSLPLNHTNTPVKSCQVMFPFVSCRSPPSQAALATSRMHHKLLQKYLNSSTMAKPSFLVAFLLVVSQTVHAEGKAAFSFENYYAAQNEGETPEKASYSFSFGAFGAANTAAEAPFGAKGLCVVGCTPYVDPSDPTAGILKYRELVREMAKDCDVLVHVGDTKPGKMACNRTVMTNAAHILEEAGRLENKLVLYAPGDNELNDCHRHDSGDTKVPSDIYKAAEARKFLAEDLRLESSTDLTGRYALDNHDMSDKIVPGTDQPYSCDFDKYVELDNYAIATLEVIGSHMYLDDERQNGYPYQDEVDPLEGRLSMFLNAKDCALDWIEQSAEKASLAAKEHYSSSFMRLFTRLEAPSLARAMVLANSTVPIISRTTPGN
jgi:hypothetical protein